MRTSALAGILASRRTAQKAALTSRRRYASFRKSSAEPMVVVNTREVFPGERRCRRWSKQRAAWGRWVFRGRVDRPVACRIEPGPGARDGRWRGAAGAPHRHRLAPKSPGRRCHAGSDSCLRLNKDGTSALAAMIAMMCHPCLAQHLASEAALPAFNLAVPGVTRVRLAGVDCKSVRRGSDANDRPPGFHVVDDPLHLVVRQAAKSSEQNQEIGLFECLEAGDVAPLMRIDGAVAWVDREQDRAIEALTIGEDLRQLRQHFFGMVFVVAAIRTIRFPLPGPAWPLNSTPAAPKDGAAAARKSNAAANRQMERGVAGDSGGRRSGKLIMWMASNVAQIACGPANFEKSRFARCPENFRRFRW